MSYTPPGVIVTQVQKTVSPTLIEPDLPAGVVGPAYHVVDLDPLYSAAYSSYDNNGSTSYTISGLDATMALDTNSVYVDLLMPLTASSNAGALKVVAASDLTVTSSTVRIAAQGASWIGATVRIGYRALRSDLAAAYLYESVAQLDNDLGDLSVKNPLGFALATSLNNGNSAVWSYGLRNDEFNGVTVSGTNAINHGLALDELALQEVYTLAPLTVSSAIISTYKTHVNSYSAPTEKKERIAVVAPKISWDSPAAPSTNRATTAAAVSSASASMGAKRVIYAFPDVAMILESRHISTLNPNYITNAFTNGFSTTVRAYLAQIVTFKSTNSVTAYQGVTVYPTPGVGEEITSSLWSALVSHAQETGVTYFNAYVPVPAAIATAPAIAGQIAGLAPEQPLTNLALAGIDAVKYSSDWFTESQLNTIAQGGTYILKQSKPTSSIVCRHQLSTDMSSIEKREVSITKTVDYAAKFVRNAVAPFIGKYVINVSTLNLLNTVIKGAGELLVRDGHLNGFKVASLAQDTVEKDTVLVSIEILPPYPVNYIKIDLIF